ncbi:MAG: DUF4190 domain-containing protein [Verrucomicrobia bacterium]|nr:DUF4190 domain-containing protein [Verrucomicrobiota bacterium]
MNPVLNSSLRPHRGVLILVFGILGLVLCFPFGIAAWIMGNGDLSEIRGGRMDPTGEGLTQAGRICGIVATVLAILGVLVFFLMLAFGAFASVMG